MDLSKTLKGIDYLMLDSNLFVESIIMIKLYQHIIHFYTDNFVVA